MTALIQQRIDPVSRRWLIGNQIAAILLVELQNQVQLATDRDEDPAPYQLRVFRERSNPWDEFGDPSAPDANLSPIVNVWFDNRSVNRSASNPINRDRVTGVYQIDCYAYAPSRETGGGHDPGDLEAARIADATAEVVRAILMSGPYAYLGLPRREQQYVTGRFAETITMFQPQIENRFVENVHAGRISFHVEFSEKAPETTGEPLELIDVQIRQLETGELLLGAQFQSSDS